MATFFLYDGHKIMDYLCIAMLTMGSPASTEIQSSCLVLSWYSY